jgi:choline dehydrogenase-like flavoprotein
MGITTRRKLQLDNNDKPSFGGSGHIMSTTRMSDKAYSVDKHRRAHDHHNLFLLGSSVFPTSSTANSSTIVALGLRAAETVAKQCAFIIVKEGHLPGPHCRFRKRNV